MASHFNHLVTPLRSIALRILWLDDKRDIAGLWLPRAIATFADYFDIRHCETLSEMQWLVHEYKWNPDVILADWDMEPSHSRETDPRLRAASKARAAGLRYSAAIAERLWNSGEFCRVISCSAYQHSRLSDMVQGHDEYAADCGLVISTAIEPALLDDDTSGLKTNIDDSSRILSTVAMSFRKGLESIADRGQLRGPGYTEWKHLMAHTAKASTLKALAETLAHAEPLRLGQERVIPITALFADIWLAESIDLRDAKDTIAQFCKSINFGKWNQLVLKHEDGVREVFSDVLNRWPVRLLRDGEFTDQQDLQDLSLISGADMTNAFLKKRIKDFGDKDDATCVLAMLIALEARERAQLSKKTLRQIARECLRDIKQLEREAGHFANAVVAEIQRLTFDSGDSELIANCWRKWKHAVSTEDVVRLAWPIHRNGKLLTIPGIDSGKGPGNHLRTDSHWKNDPKIFEQQFREAHTMRCAIDRFVTQIAREWKMDRDEIRSRLHKHVYLT